MHDAQVSGTPPTCTKRPSFEESSDELSSIDGADPKGAVDPKSDSDSDSESTCVAGAVSAMSVWIHRTITARQQAAAPTTPPTVAKMANSVKVALRS